MRGVAMKKILGSALLAGTIVSAVLSPVPVLAQVKALVGGIVVDLDRGTTIPDAVVLIEKERITAVGTANQVSVPPEAERIDLKGRYLLPGFMNMHVHLGLKLPGAAGAALADETDAELALRMAENARKSLYVGTTTVRLPGDARHAEFAVRAAIERGEIKGPRIYSAGQSLMPTGGHGAARRRVGVDGPVAAMEHTRAQIQAGATWIKLMISKGLADERGDIAASDMTLEEMKAVTDIAHRQGVKVTAHSGSPEATLEALEAGVESFEHGYYLNRDVFRAMKKKGAWYIPTIVVSEEGVFEFFRKIGAPDWYFGRVHEVGKSHWNALETAIELGVNIAMGTDQFPYEPNNGTTSVVRETELYVKAGMSPLQALRVAMVAPAHMMGVEADLGGLTVGKYADIIGIGGDPLENISALRSLDFVVKGGDVIRDGD